MEHSSKKLANPSRMLKFEGRGGEKKAVNSEQENRPSAIRVSSCCLERL